MEPKNYSTEEYNKLKTKLKKEKERRKIAEQALEELDWYAWSAYLETIKEKKLT